MTYHADPNTIPSALPFDYDKTTNFSEWEQDHPGEPTPGALLDAEFDDIEKALDETQDRLALIQREDGNLQNDIVTADAIAASAKSAIALELYGLSGNDPAADAINAALSAQAASDSADTATAQALLSAQSAVDAAAEAANALASAVAAANSASAFWKNAIVDFECAADNTTDDTDALQASIDWAFTWGGTVYYPHGSYVARNLSKVVSGSGLGPATFVGAGATPALASHTRGTRFVQPADETGTLLTLTGDWGTNPNWPIQGVRMSGICFKTGAACAGWAIYCKNVTMRHNHFTDLCVQATNSGAAGGILMDSCWGVTCKNIDLYGPSSGTYSRGFVVYGTAGNGTTNQMMFENINCRNWGYCGAQLGKVQEASGGFMQGVSWTGGQCGTNGYYGMIIGRVMDYVVSTVHTENNGRNGFWITADAGGVASQHGRIVCCDSFNDGQDATTGDPTSYAVYVQSGKKIRFESFRFQQTKFAIYVANADGVTDITFNDITFGGKLAAAKSGTLTVSGATYAAGDSVTVTASAASTFALGDIGKYLVLDTQNGSGEEQPRLAITSYTSGTIVTCTLVDALPVAFQGVATNKWEWADELSGCAFTISSPTAASDRIITLGRHSFAYRWGNRIDGVDYSVVTNSTALTVEQENTAAAIVTALTADGELEVYPWTRRVRLTLSAADSLVDIVAKGQYTLGAQQEIQILFGDGDTTILDATSTPAGNFRLRQSRDWTPTQYDSIDLSRNSGKFWETARNMNAQAGAKTVLELDVADATNNGSGLIRIETTAAHGWATGMSIQIAAVGGTTEANGDWTITVVDSTTFDLQGSAFVNPYTALTGTAWAYKPVINNLTRVLFIENGATARSIKGFTSTAGKEVYEGQIVFVTTQATANLSMIDGSGTDDLATVSSATVTMLVNDTVGFLYRFSKWRQIPYANN